jgi:hypothetical protein
MTSSERHWKVSMSDVYVRYSSGLQADLLRLGIFVLV